jgi:hypothetical protein
LSPDDGGDHCSHDPDHDPDRDHGHDADADADADHGHDPDHDHDVRGRAPMTAVIDACSGSTGACRCPRQQRD